MEVPLQSSVLKRASVGQYFAAVGNDEEEDNVDKEELFDRIRSTVGTIIEEEDTVSVAPLRDG